MKYSIAIVEDNPHFSDSVKGYLDRYSKEFGIDFNVFLFTDGDEITSDYEAKYDIIFLDIEMKRLDGMSAAQKIRTYDSEVIIIFITNMAQYAIHGYNVGALSFLLKPLPYFAFSQELTKSIDRLKNRKQKALLVPTDNGMIKLSSIEITYIESFGHDLIIHVKDHSYIIRGTIKKMEEELIGLPYYRCNHGYLVNLAYVQAVKDDEVIIGEDRLKISRPRKKAFLSALTQYIGGTL